MVRYYTFMPMFMLEMNLNTDYSFKQSVVEIQITGRCSLVHIVGPESPKTRFSAGDSAACQGCRVASLPQTLHYTL